MHHLRNNELREACEVLQGSSGSGRMGTSWHLMEANSFHGGPGHVAVETGL